jgi:cytochrome c553
MAFNLFKWWPGMSRPSTFDAGPPQQADGEIRRFRCGATPGTLRHCPRQTRVNALNALRTVGFLLAVVPVVAPLAAHAQSVADKAQTCAACHGDDGIPADKSWPVIWGQYQGYLYLQLRDFKSGARKSDVMGPVAQDLSRDDMLAIALYFSQKPWPDLRQPRAPSATAALAAQTNTSVGCTGCHQDGFKGEGTQPRLAGQSGDYLLQTMLDFRTRARGNNPGMSDLMDATSEDGLKAMATYLAGL